MSWGFLLLDHWELVYEIAFFQFALTIRKFNLSTVLQYFFFNSAMWIELKFMQLFLFLSSQIHTLETSKNYGALYVNSGQIIWKWFYDIWW